jgi:hypothetical protein
MLPGGLSASEDRWQLFERLPLPVGDQIGMDVKELGDLRGCPDPTDCLHGDLRLQARRVSLAASWHCLSPFSMPPIHLTGLSRKPDPLLGAGPGGNCLREPQLDGSHEP